MPMALIPIGPMHTVQSKLSGFRSPAFVHKITLVAHTLNHTNNRTVDRKSDHTVEHAVSATSALQKRAARHEQLTKKLHGFAIDGHQNRYTSCKDRFPDEKLPIASQR